MSLQPGKRNKFLPCILSKTNKEIKRFPPLHHLDATEEEHGMDVDMEETLSMAQ
jgi:hypothetical protein